MKILILFYSMYGHNYAMAKAAAEGVAAAGGEAVLRRVPETLPPEVLVKMNAVEPQKGWPEVPEATRDDPAEYDGLIICTPTRFGNMCGQMRQYIDGLGGLWAKGALVGKPAGVMASSNTQHGGQESTILTTHVSLLHLGMIIVGLPYSFQGQTRWDEITGCSPYGASTIAGGDGSRQPSDNELDGARFQAEHLTRIAAKLAS